MCDNLPNHSTNCVMIYPIITHTWVNYYPSMYYTWVMIHSSITHTRKYLPIYKMGIYLHNMCKYCVNIYPNCVFLHTFARSVRFNWHFVAFTLFCRRLAFVAMHALFWVKFWLQKLRSCKLFDKYHVSTDTKHRKNCECCPVSQLIVR